MNWIYSRITYSAASTFFGMLFLPLVASAAPRTFRELACQVAELLDTATFVLILFGLVVYFWGIAVNIPHFGEEKGGEKRQGFFIWGIVILFVMVSIWGIIQLLQATLGVKDPSGGGAGAVCF
jgi:hypothetical protein